MVCNIGMELCRGFQHYSSILMSLGSLSRFFCNTISKQGYFIFLKAATFKIGCKQISKYNAFQHSISCKIFNKHPIYLHRIPCNQTRLERGRDNRRATPTGRLSYQELCDGTGGSLCPPCCTVSVHSILPLYPTPGVNGGRQNLRPTPRTHTRKKQQQRCNNCHFVTSIFTIKFPSHMR